MSDRVKWGVLSTARIGLQAFVPGVQRFAEHGEVVAIGSRDPAAARQAATDCGIARAHESYEALLADPEVEAIYNPLPNHLHAEWTMRAADAGKHVLCEKPLALDAAEAQRMADHCAAAGVLLMEAFMYRFHPQWVAVKELVDSGRLGELRAVQVWFSYFNRDPDNIRNVVAYGGGGLMDIGCYPISVARWLFAAEPDDVQGSLYRDPDFDVDVIASGILRFGPGHASFLVSTQLEPFQRVQIAGSRGRIEVEIPFNAPNDRPTRIFVTAGGDPPAAPATETVEFPAADQYALQADAFARAIRGGTAVPTPPADAVANMRVIDALRAG